MKMETTKKETVISFSNVQAKVRFFDGTLLTVDSDGKISVRKAGKSYTLVPSTLRFSDGVEFDATEESAFLSQKIDINPEISFNVRTEKAGRIRIEMFFQERDGDETVVSGCFVTKEATSEHDWSINLINTERFLFNLSEIFNEV
jgi:hypothetical protein